MTCSVVARPARAMEVVSGISLGQTATQFWALPQTWMPPSASEHRAARQRVLARGMHVEQHRLADGVRADERAIVLAVAAGLVGFVGFPFDSLELRLWCTAGRLRRSSRSSCIG
jgi:hypothetical protein